MNFKFALLALLSTFLVSCVTTKEAKKGLQMDAWVWKDLSAYEGTLVDVNIVGNRVELESYSVGYRFHRKIGSDTVYPKPEQFAAFEKKLAKLSVKTWNEDYKGEKGQLNQSWHVHLRGARPASEGINAFPSRKDPKKITTDVDKSQLKELLLALQKLCGQDVFGL